MYSCKVSDFLTNIYVHFTMSGGVFLLIGFPLTGGGGGAVHGAVVRLHHFVALI